jgi:hypothetical protein
MKIGDCYGHQNDNSNGIIHTKGGIYLCNNLLKTS